MEWLEGMLKGPQGLCCTAHVQGQDSDGGRGREGRLGGCRPWWLGGRGRTMGKFSSNCFSVSQSSWLSAQSDDRRGQVGRLKREEGFGKVVWKWGE